MKQSGSGQGTRNKSEMRRDSSWIRNWNARMKKQGLSKHFMMNAMPECIIASGPLFPQEFVLLILKLEKWKQIRLNCKCIVRIQYLHCKKKVSGFPVPSRDVTNQTPWPGIIYLFHARESLVIDIPAGDGKIAYLILQCTEWTMVDAVQTAQSFLNFIISDASGYQSYHAHIL
jgi:hypothetical protein